MRILQLSKLDDGGATRYACALNKGLCDRSVQSSLICDSDLPDSNSPSARKLKRNLNRLVSRLYVEIQQDVFHRTNLIREYEMRELFESCDVVHLHQVIDWMGMSNLMQDIPDTTPVVVSLHDLWMVTGGCVVYNGCNKYRESCRPCPILKRPYDQILANRQLGRKRRAYERRNVTFIANSEWTKKQVEGAAVVQNDHKVSVVHPSVDSTIFKPGKKTVARVELGVPDNAFVICAGSASVTDENKNIAAVLRVVQQVSSYGLVVALVFGDGVLELQGDCDVRLLGRISDDIHLSKIYQASDVFISASRMETYGMTLIEAMACEVPPVAYRTGAIPYVIDHKQTGLLASLNNELELVGAVRLLMQDEKFRKTIGKSARDVVVRRNNPMWLVDQHISIYQQLLSI